MLILKYLPCHRNVKKILFFSLMWFLDLQITKIAILKKIIVQFYCNRNTFYFSNKKFIRNIWICIFLCFYDFLNGFGKKLINIIWSKMDMDREYHVYKIWPWHSKNSFIILFPSYLWIVSIIGTNLWFYIMCSFTIN